MNYYGRMATELTGLFNLGAVLKSPLIIGTNIQTLSTSDFSILANPAVIALSQDPLGIPAQNRWNNTDAQLWSGPLASTTGSTDDMVVALINTASSTSNITASISDIFGGQTPGASQWEVRDLWAGRLSDSQAQSIMSDGAAAHSDWIYNATATPYATGLAGQQPILLGSLIGSVASTDSLVVSVESHGCSILRLRASS
jgi:alpha-galactosidase